MTSSESGTSVLRSKTRLPSSGSGAIGAPAAGVITADSTAMFTPKVALPSGTGFDWMVTAGVPLEAVFEFRSFVEFSLMARDVILRHLLLRLAAVLVGQWRSFQASSIFFQEISPSSQYKYRLGVSSLLALHLWLQ